MQARNVLFKKFLPPVIKTPKQVISIIQRYGSYDGTDDVVRIFNYLFTYLPHFFVMNINFC